MSDLIGTISSSTDGLFVAWCQSVGRPEYHRLVCWVGPEPNAISWLQSSVLIVSYFHYINFCSGDSVLTQRVGTWSLWAFPSVSLGLGYLLIAVWAGIIYKFQYSSDAISINNSLFSLYEKITGLKIFSPIWCCIYFILHMDWAHRISQSVVKDFCCMIKHFSSMILFYTDFPLSHPAYFWNSYFFSPTFNSFSK